MVNRCGHVCACGCAGVRACVGSSAAVCLSPPSLIPHLIQTFTQASCLRRHVPAHCEGRALPNDHLLKWICFHSRASNRAPARQPATWDRRTHRVHPALDEGVIHWLGQEQLGQVNISHAPDGAHDAFPLRGPVPGGQLPGTCCLLAGAASSSSRCCAGRC